LILFPSATHIHKQHSLPQENQKVKEPTRWFSHFCSFQWYMWGSYLCICH